MTGYCSDCGRELFGAAGDDFAGMINRLLVEAGYGLVVECQHCGPALVDGDGRRIEAQPCNA